jgi:ribonuclease HI
VTEGFGTMRSPGSRGVVVATDGSVRDIGKRRAHVGAAYLDDAGDWWMEWRLHPKHLPSAHLALHAELRAIRNAETKHLHPVTIWSDCADAVELVKRWKSGDMIPIPGYCGRSLVHFARRLRDKPDRVEVKWLRGHHGHALNEGADTLARLASRAHKDRLPRGEVRERASGIAEAFTAAFRSVAA